MKIFTEKEISKKLNRKKARNKVVRTIVYLIIILILITNIILLVQKIQNPQKIPSIFGYKTFIITSGSMEPTISVGDVIIVKEVSQENIEIGDIITFSEGEYQVTHKIIDILNEDGQNVYQTKGDANNTKDKEPVKYENIEGKYIFKIGKIGTVIMKLQNPIAIAVIAIIVYFIYSIVEKKDDRKIARRKKREEFEKEQENNK